MPAAAEFFATLPGGADATMMMVNGRVAPRHVSAHRAMTCQLLLLTQSIQLAPCLVQPLYMSLLHACQTVVYALNIF
jgi:hypothetical protein